MSYKAYQTENGIEIRDGGDVVITVNSWPPRDEDKIDALFDDADISDPTRSVLHLLLGVGGLIDDTPDDE